MVMRIRELREARGMTQQQLAASMNKQQNNVSNWETENALPRARELPMLARCLGVSIDELYAPAEQAD